MILSGIGEGAMPEGLPGTGELHIWSVDLRDARWDACAEVLAASEAARYSRVLRPSARDEWRRSRIALRLLLGCRLGIEPHALRFSLGPFGKPRLDRVDGSLAHVPSFNLSHSGGGALIVLANDEVGIDLERLKVSRGHEARLLETLLAPGELTSSATADRAAATISFHRVWTRKEAYCKAIGHGLRKPMADVRIVTSGKDGASRAYDSRPVDGMQWYVHDLACDCGWMAAACTTSESPIVFRAVLEPPSVGAGQ